MNKIALIEIGAYDYLYILFIFPHVSSVVPVDLTSTILSALK